MANTREDIADIEEKMKILAESNNRLEEQISSLINRVLQFMNLYFVFQGMVFSSVMSSSTKINCKLRWIPFTLSLLVSIFNFLAVWENINKSLELYEEVVSNWKSLDIHRKDKLRLQSLGSGPSAAGGLQPPGSGQLARGGAGQPQSPGNRRSAHSYKLTLRRAVSYLTLLLLFVFMGVMLCGCFQIECV